MRRQAVSAPVAHLPGVPSQGHHFLRHPWCPECGAVGSGDGVKATSPRCQKGALSPPEQSRWPGPDT